jgi:undecaprenyl-diphosphatase
VAPGAAGALLVGLAHGLAIVPGCSRIGAAFVVLRWLGVAQWRAAELALMVSVPVMELGGARLVLERPDFSALDASQMTLAMLLSFVAAALGASWFKALCERHRAAALSLWLVPLSLAILAYSRALPDPMEAIPAPPPSGMHSSAERERRASWLTPTL